jgi:hypothetical protein
MALKIALMLLSILAGAALSQTADANGVTPTSSYPTRITSVNGGGCLDAPLPQPANASAGGVWWLQQYPCNGGTNQHWLFQFTPSNTVVIHSAANAGFCLDLPNGSTTSSTPVQLYPCHGGISQQWVLKQFDSTSAAIIPAAAPSMVLDVANGIVNAPAQIQIFPQQNSKNQLWRFPIDGLPQGLTGGIAHVNHECGPNVSAFGALGLAAIGLAACGAAILAPSPEPGPLVMACAPAVSQFSGLVQALPGTSFESCGPPSVFRSGWVLAPGTNAKVPTLWLNSGGTSFSVQAATGWLTGSDGDFGNSSNFGFYHQELREIGGGVVDPSVSDRFVLPQGAVCGFHHSRNTPYDPMASFAFGKAYTCMGQDAAQRLCPAGWTAKNHFDWSSGDGQASCVDLNAQQHCAYFAWCEYQDPNGLCASDPNCLANSRQLGVGLLVSSNTDPAGAAPGRLISNPPVNDAPCPVGWIRTNAYDDGRPAGQGLSWCHPLPDDLPQGLTAGMSYMAAPPYPPWRDGVALGSETLKTNGDGFIVRHDGDLGIYAGGGFWHQELGAGGVTDPALSDQLKLLPGAACGFHHTLNTPGLTCMGLDPASGCPNGWVARRHFDMSSGTGYFVWCEYQDPNGLCAGPAAATDCGASAKYIGYATGISSNTDRDGTALANGGACPVGWNSSPFFDAGRPSGQGLHWCMP